MKPPTLVLLTAGLGTRYGAAKQIATVGPDGEWLLEYAVHDALAVGFARVVLVIRDELREALTARLAPHLDGRAELRLIAQTLRAVPEGCAVPRNRSKPLGTGHALWCCAALLDGPFAVINGDDYYGPNAFALLAQHFRATGGPAMVGYRLDQTLSPNGGVNRGVCRLAGGKLAGVTEFTGIVCDPAGIITGTAPDGETRPLPADTAVSLNCWGLTPAFLPSLGAGLRRFLAAAGPRDEYFLPHAIAACLSASGTRLAVLPSHEAWLGLTYAADRTHVRRAIALAHRAGTYPTPLWEHG